MEMDKIKDNIEHWKLLGELLIEKDIPAFIKEINGDLHFCDILLIGENSVEVLNFAPEQRAGKKEIIFWFKIERFEELKGGEERK